MSLIKKKVYVTQEMYDSMLASFKSAYIAIGVVATILVLLALYYHIRYKRASGSEDINKYKELRLNSALFLIPCAVASFLSLGFYPTQVGGEEGYKDVQLTDLKGFAHFDGQTLKIDPLPSDYSYTNYRIDPASPQVFEVYLGKNGSSNATVIVLGEETSVPNNDLLYLKD